MTTLIQGSSLAPVNTNRSLGPNWPSGNSGFFFSKTLAKTEMAKQYFRIFVGENLPGPTWPCSISGFLPAKSLLGPNWPSSISGFLPAKSLFVAHARAGSS